MRCGRNGVNVRRKEKRSCGQVKFGKAKLAAIAGALLTFLASACGSGSGGSLGGPPPPQGEFFFVENLSQTVDGFDVLSGHLASIPGSGTMLTLPPITLAADPKGQFLGLIEFLPTTTPQVQLAAVQPGGTLQLGTKMPVAGASNLAFSGNDLIAVVDQNDEQVETFSIQNGTLALVSSAATGALPGDVLFSADNRTLYVGNTFGDSISVYSVSAGGSIQSLQTFPLPFLTGQVIAPVVRLRLNPEGDKLAATTGIGQLYVCQVSTTDGTLSAAKETVVADGANLEEVIFDPSGKNIYTGDQLNGGLYEFAVAADGTAMPLQGSPLPTLTLLSGMVINGAGDRVYAVTGSNSEITTYLRDATTGILTATTDEVNTGGFLPGRIVRLPAH